jgi:hypothetical protein
MLQRQARHQQFQAYKTIAELLGYGRHREVDFRSRAVLDTDGAQEAAAGVQWTSDFLADTDTNVLALMTREPKPSLFGKGLPNEFMFGARSLSVVVNQQTTTFTDTEIMEILRKSREMILQIKSGADIVFERQLAHLLRGAPGLEVHSDGQAAPVTVRSTIVPITEGDDIDDPIVVFPNGSLQAQLIGQGAWTTTDDITVELELHGWVSIKGAIDASGKVARLSELAGVGKGELERRISGK